MYNDNIDIKLNIPLVKQKEDSDDCLRACMYMVLNFLGVNISKEEAWEDLVVYKKNTGLLGAYFTDVGVIAIKRGLRSTIYHADWTWWNKESFEAVTHKDKLLEALKKLKNNKKKMANMLIVDKEINFVKYGGKFIFKYPHLELIDSYLERNIPVIISVNGAVLNEDQKHDNLHAIVVIGREEDNYFINDPFLENKKVNKNKLLYAWSRHGGWLLAIEK